MDVNTKPLIHVVDDDSATLKMLRAILATQHYESCGYSDARSLLERYHPEHPGCIITDLCMPGMTGLELLEALSVHVPHPVVILHSGYGEVPLAVEAMRKGAFDFIEKPAKAEAMLKAVEKALAFDRANREALAEHQALRRRYEQLSEREREVLGWVVDGLTNKQIAEQLGLSPRTVEIHRANMMIKMEADTLAGLIRQAPALERLFGSLSAQENNEARFEHTP